MLYSTATAVGSKHVNPGKPAKMNNQDVLVFREHPQGLVVVICDGCSEQPSSGVGADIGANLTAKIVSRELEKHGDVTLIDWVEVTQQLRIDLMAVATIMARDYDTESFERMVAERFLFTTLVAVVHDDHIVVAALGDGLVIEDDKVHVIEPPIPNSPPYIGYLLLRDTGYHSPEFVSHLQFRPVLDCKMSELQKGVIVATDGLKPLLQEDLHHPALLAGPRNLQRWLNVQTTEKVENDTIVPGRCDDDVTFVIFRTEEQQRQLMTLRLAVVEFLQKLKVIEDRLKTLSNLSGYCSKGERRFRRRQINSYAIGLNELEAAGQSCGRSADLDRVWALLEGVERNLGLTSPQKDTSTDNANSAVKVDVRVEATPGAIKSEDGESGKSASIYQLLKEFPWLI